MDETQAPSLRLTIVNPAAATAGASTDHQFSARGGSIGTAANDTWRLSSQRTGAVPGHAEIRFLDGVFCLIDRSGRTFINGGSQPVGRGRRARLNHGDTLVIGRYRIRAELIATAEDPRSAETAQSHDLIETSQEPLLKARGEECQWQGAEPLAPLQPAPGETVSDDPMAAWQNPAGAQAPDAESDALMASKAHWLAGERAVSDEYREHRDVAVGLPIRKGDNGTMTGMHENGNTPVTTGAQSRGKPSASQDRSSTHISGAPLLRGLEAELDFADSDEMRLFLEEAGQTLKATMEGLLALHQCEDSRHQALRTRLQPIEDNPLRLGDGYQATVETLFASQRSPVHLSAPAAVRESLQSLNHHQQATRAGISEALQAILHAFSPEALLQRFHGYRRGLRQNEDEGRWAWDMYQHYYRELKSSRQQGFERLFQEVFEQAYDQHLRQLQRESQL
ncbi:MAG: type VI secretion system-associated FHA domain protein TagH [Pseudomonadota bacterium]|nr:type VI secretion system-associated FHA domain protein TagH [Pseudomonadota bacterium]